MDAGGTTIASNHPFTSSVQLFDGATLAAIGDPIPTGNLYGDTSVLLSADGRAMFADDPFGRPAKWVLDPDEWERIACHAAGRNLTRAEHDRYLGREAAYRPTCAEWPPGT